MKRHQLFIVLGLLLAVTGCQHDEFADSGSVYGTYSLVATIEGKNANADTRTTVNDEGNVAWCANDAIGVFGGTTRNARFVTTESGSNAIFTGNMNSEGEEAVWAYYPYDENATADGTSLDFTLPATYRYTGMSYAPMIGKASVIDERITFRQLGGLIRIILGKMPDDAERFVITSTGTSAPALAGKAHVENVTEYHSVYTIINDESASQSVTYNIEEMISGDGFATFFIPVPVGHYSKLEIAFYRKGQTEPQFARSISEVDMQRAVMLDMPMLNAMTGASYVLAETTRELTPETDPGVKVVEDDPTALLFEAGTTSRLPQVGEIIYARPCDEYPYGFMGRVSKVTTLQDGSGSVETETVALKDVFDCLYVNQTTEMKLDKDEAETRMFGRTYDYTSLKINVQDDGTHSSVTGEAGLGFETKLNIEIDKSKGLEYIAFTADARLKLEVDLNVEFELNGEDDQGKQFGKILASSFTGVPIPLSEPPVLFMLPRMNYYLYVVPSAKLSFQTGFATEYQLIAGYEYKNGESKGRFSKLLSSNSSPWDMSSISISGEFFYGIGIEFAGCLEGRNDMKIGLEEKAGCKLSGEVKVDTGAEGDLLKQLANTKLESCNTVSATFNADASLFGSGLKVEVPLAEVEWNRREISLLPMFKELIASVKTLSNEEGQEEIAADLSTEVGGEIMTKKATVSYELINDVGEVLSVSNPVEYTGNLQEETPIEDWSLQNYEPQTTTFSNLEKNVQYKVYPVVESPLLKNYTEDGKVRLKDSYVDFCKEEEMSERDILIAFYNATGGNNWAHNRYWCSDAPLNSWYGVTCDSEGKVTKIELTANKLSGSGRLFGLSALESVYLGWNELTSLSISKCSNLKTIYCCGYQLTSLNVSGCVNLNTLECGNNQLTSLNVSECVNLNTLECSGNQLTYLDVSKFVNLNTLKCSGNQLTYLDVSKCTELKILYCSGNELHSLDVSKCPQLVELSCPYLPNVHYCPDLEVLYSRVVSNSDISRCSKLRVLGLTDCKTIDLSNCPDLRELGCSGEFTSLDVSSCPQLRKLSCFGELTSLDVSSCPQLRELRCERNKITELNLSNSIELRRLSCPRNNLVSLDLSNCPQLEELDCERNDELSSIDFTGCSKLKYIHCERCGGYLSGYHTFESIDISDCPNLESLYFEYTLFKKIYLVSDPPTLKGTYWGGEDSEYREPNHKNYRKYPEFIYK